MGGFPQSEPVHVTTTQLKKQNFPAPQEIPCVPPAAPGKHCPDIGRQR